MLRHNASQISQKDRSFFPKYWFNPYQIIIHKNTSGDTAILFRRELKSKTDKITFRMHNIRIEETILPNLDYQKFPMFRIRDNKHHIVIQGVTCNINDHPLFTIGMGSEIKFMMNRIEASVQGYPKEFELLWVFTFPSEKFFSKNRAQSDADEDFWSGLSQTLAANLNTILTKKLEANTTDLLIESIENVRSEFNKLISRNDLVEQQLQNFLDQHYFLLFDGRPIIKKTRKIGSYVSDFKLELEDGNIILVELQLNSDPIIINGKPSGGFKEALNQINEWFEWLESNEEANLGNYSGLIILGRKEDYDKHQKTITKIITKSRLPLTFRTYDDLNDNINKIEKILCDNKKTDKN